jgi:hypothetical protein
VIVVEEDARVRLALELDEDGVGEIAVHGHVSLAPGMVQAVVDARHAGEAEEVVLDEPERGVRDDVVVPVVRARIVRHEAKAIGGAVCRRLGDRLVARFERNVPILLRDRARDPGHLVMADEAPQRCDEPTAPAPGDPVVRRVAMEGDGPAVRDNDELPADHALTSLRRP